MSASLAATPLPLPTPSTGDRLLKTGILVNAVDGLNSGIQFQRLDASGIGIQAVIDMGLLNAVDVWGTIGVKYKVCFPQAGAIHAVIPYQTTLPATARASGWFKVTYDAREGWASGRYLATYEACRIGSIT